MKVLLLCLILFISISAYALDKDICGTQDERIPSNISFIGRTLKEINSHHGCTVTLISNSCAISAGHCSPVLNIVEFNVPRSNADTIEHPSLEDIYEIDQSSIVTSRGLGKDFAVFKLRPNSLTNKLPGVMQGVITKSGV
jgi:hypothetical protein